MWPPSKPVTEASSPNCSSTRLTVRALPASGLFGCYAVNVIDDQLVELIARINRRVHSNGQNHVRLLLKTGPRPITRNASRQLKKPQNTGYLKPSTQAPASKSAIGAVRLSENLAVPSASARSRLVRQGAVKRGGIDLLVMPSKLNGELPARWLRAASTGRRSLKRRNLYSRGIRRGPLLEELVKEVRVGLSLGSRPCCERRSWRSGHRARGSSRGLLSREGKA